MSESVWTVPADELRQRAASTDPTPGSGAIAAVAGALGIALVQKALAITDDAPERLRERAQELAARAAAAADGDVAAFGAVIEASGGADDGDDGAVESATIDATEEPLALLGALVEALALAAEAESLVKRVLVSDVLAGADLIRGAARAALRAVDLDLHELEHDGSDASGRLRARRDDLVARLDADA